MVKIAVGDIEKAAKAALCNHGSEDWIAQSVAHAIARAEAFGNRICGLYYLESYCQQLVSGRVNGKVIPEVTRVRPGFVKADAKFGFAQPAFMRALPEASKAARENGIAVLAVGLAERELQRVPAVPQVGQLALGERVRVEGPRECAGLAAVPVVAVGVLCEGEVDIGGHLPPLRNGGLFRVVRPGRRREDDERECDRHSWPEPHSSPP